MNGSQTSEPDLPIARAVELRPAQLCGELIAALEASEGRRKRRARNTTADSIGLQIKQDLLAEIVRADPDPADFEGWLVERCIAEGLSDGPLRAMALIVWEEWRLAESTGDFRHWLAAGAPSDDREVPSTKEDSTGQSR
ncbi:MAG: hypothetical protein H0W30_07010 [Gemmatimonadaceae bacterium]|nr:hypothetical protein [Gemmatimonadaceae bacterium]